MTPGRRPTPSGRALATAVVLAALVLAVLGLWRAAGPDVEPTLRERVDAVAATLRCPTCQGLSIRDSSSVLAAGSRETIEAQLAEGRTPDQIRQYFVDRYGEYVLLSPGTSGPGLLAWALPGLVLLLAAALGWRWLRWDRAGPGEPAPGADEDEDARTALAAFRAGALAPDDSPAGDALHAALLARVAAEEDEQPDPEGLRRAGARLAAAHRRYTARATAPTERSPGPLLPRRALTLGTAALLVAVAGAAVVLGIQDRGVAEPATRGVPGAGSAGPSADVSALVAATRQRPEDPGLWIALGRAYDRNGADAQALAAYDRAIELQPGADDLVLLRANLLVRTGSPAEALPELEGLAARYPDDPDVLLILGLAQEGSGDVGAAATLRRFLELAPDSPAAPGVRALLGER